MNSRCLASMGALALAIGITAGLVAPEPMAGQAQTSTKSRGCCGAESRGQGKHRRVCRTCRDIGPITPIRRCNETPI